jgi:uncharacterized iron-regulated membrane protein
MRGPGVTNAEGGLVIGVNDNYSVVLNGRTLNNSGAASWVGRLGARLTAQHASVFNNLAGATFDVPAGNGLSWSNDNGDSVFNNFGTLTVEAGSNGTTEIDAAVTDQGAGTIQVNSGTLFLAGGGSDPNSISGAGALEFGGGNRTFTISGTYNVAGGTSAQNATVNFVAGTKVEAVGPLAIFNGGTLNFSTGAAIDTPTLALTNPGDGGGTLAGSDTVNVSGLTRWVDGTMSGKGTTNAQGGLAIGAADGNHHLQVLDARTVNASGPITWAGQFGDRLVARHASAFNVLAGATFSVPGGNGLVWTNDTGDSTFTNAGTVTVAAGAGTTEIDVAFTDHSQGSVQVTSGTLLLAGGGSDASSISGAGSVEFGGGRTFNESGRYNVTGGTTVVNATANFLAGARVQAVGPLSVASGGTLNFSTGSTITTPSLALTNAGGGGTLTGSDTVTVSGLTDWADGTMSGKGITNAEGGLTLGANDGNDHSQVLDSRTINSAGPASWFGLFGDRVDATHASSFNVLAGATFDVPNGNGLFWTNDTGDSTFRNAGTVTLEAGSGTTRFDVAFIDQGQGSVQVNTGTLFLNGGGGDSKGISGAGAVEFGGNGTTFNESGTYNIAGGTFVPSGTVNFLAGAKVQSVGPLTIFSGTASFSSGAAIDIPSLYFINTGGGNGTLTGSDTITVAGLTNWVDGVMSGSGITNALGGLVLGAADSNQHIQILNARTVNNTGAAQWLGQFGNVVVAQNASSFNNLAGATFTIPSGNGLLWRNDTGNSSFSNAGTLTVAAGTGTTEFDVSFTDKGPGSVQVRSGTLLLTGGGNDANSISGAGTVAFGGGSSQVFTETGTYHVSGGTQALSSILDFAPGAKVQSVGPVTIGSGGTVNFSSGAAITTPSLTITNGTLTGSARRPGSTAP